MQLIKMHANNYQRITNCLCNTIGTFLKTNWNLEEIRELCNDNHDSIDELANRIVLYNGFVLRPARDQDATYLVYLIDSHDNSKLPYVPIGEIPYGIIVPSDNEQYGFVDIDDDIWRRGIIRYES